MMSDNLRQEEFLRLHYGLSVFAHEDVVLHPGVLLVLLLDISLASSFGLALLLELAFQLLLKFVSVHVVLEFLDHNGTNTTILVQDGAWLVEFNGSRFEHCLFLGRVLGLEGVWTVRTLKTSDRNWLLAPRTPFLAASHLLINGRGSRRRTLLGSRTHHTRVLHVTAILHL